MQLTKTEREILQLLTLDKTAKEIANSRKMYANQMIDGDNGNSPYSPCYTGTTCNTCGKHTYSPDIDGNCEECEHIDCTLCGEFKPLAKSALYLGRHICNDCEAESIAEGESVHLQVIQAIQREADKRETYKKASQSLASFDVGEFQKIIAQTFKPQLQTI